MSDHIFNHLTSQQRLARTEAFKWLTHKWRLKEQETEKKISKNVRRRICLEMDLKLGNLCNLEG